MVKRCAKHKSTNHFSINQYCLALAKKKRSKILSPNGAAAGLFLGKIITLTAQNLAVLNGNPSKDTARFWAVIPLMKTKTSRLR